MHKIIHNIYLAVTNWQSDLRQPISFRHVDRHKHRLSRPKQSFLFTKQTPSHEISRLLNINAIEKIVPQLAVCVIQPTRPTDGCASEKFIGNRRHTYALLSHKYQLFPHTKKHRNVYHVAFVTFARPFVRTNVMLILNVRININSMTGRKCDMTNILSSIYTHLFIILTYIGFARNYTYFGITEYPMRAYYAIFTLKFPHPRVSTRQQRPKTPDAIIQPADQIWIEKQCSYRVQSCQFVEQNGARTEFSWPFYSCHESRPNPLFSHNSRYATGQIPH